MRRNDPYRQNNSGDNRYLSSSNYSQSQNHEKFQQRNERQYLQHETKGIGQKKIEPLEVPKLSLTNINSENNFTPPLRNRNIEKNDPRNLPQLRGAEHVPLGGSMKFPSIQKKSNVLSNGYHGEGNNIERRKERGRAHPRELQPLLHAPIDKFRDQFEEPSSSRPSIPSHLRPGRGALQPLNPMLKSTSLSKIEVDHQRTHEKNLPSNHTKSLAPLNHSGRIQPVHSTRPW